MSTHIEAKQIANMSFHVFCHEMQEAFEAGFVLDELNSPSIMFSRNGNLYEASLVKREERVDVIPKPTRAEILAAAKAEVTAPKRVN